MSLTKPLITYPWKKTVHHNPERSRYTHKVSRCGTGIKYEGGVGGTFVHRDVMPIPNHRKSKKEIHGFKDCTYLGAWDTEDNLQIEWRYRVLSFLTERFAFWISQEVKDEKLKQWRHKQELKSPFECDRYHKFNNGRGRVNGLRWDITDQNYNSFQNIISDYKQYLGLTDLEQ